MKICTRLLIITISIFLASACFGQNFSKRKYRPRSSAKQMKTKLSEPAVSEPAISYEEEACTDTLFLRDGSTRIGQVIAVSGSYVKYKVCNDEKVYSTYKGDLIRVSSVKGKVDVQPKSARIVSSGRKTVSGKEMHKGANVALALSIAGIPLLVLGVGIFVLIAGFVIGIISKNKILAEPKKYSGISLARAKTAIVIPIVMAVLTLGLAVLLALAW